MINYVIEGRIAVIIGCSDDEKEIVIPEYIENVPVGKIEDNSFNELTKIKRVVLPKTIKLIGAYAFAGCKNLQEVVFSEGLEQIEDWAFISCSIEHVELPKSLKSIGENAFLGNPVRFEIENFIKSRKAKRKAVFAGKRNTAIFPIELIENLENITNDIIQDTSKYHYSQLEAFENEEISRESLDVPFLFDENDFLICLYSKVPLVNAEIVLTSSSKRLIGQYDENDPDFLILRANVISENEIIGEFVFKTPYLEEIELTIEEVFSVENKGYTYYLKTHANLGCYGTGNHTREFSMNQFHELEGKFQTQVEQNLLPAEVYSELLEQVDILAIDAVKNFLKSVSGAPVLEYMIAVFESLLADDEIENKEEIEEFIKTQLHLIYEGLSDLTSLQKACFDMHSMSKFLLEKLGLSLEDIRNRYDLTVVDGENNPLTIEEIAAYREAMETEDYNYTLYANYLNYIYQVMDKLNQEYALKTYQE